MKLPDRKYQVILADPPWQFRERVQHGGKGAGYTSGAAAFYPTMRVSDLCNMRVADLRDERGCICFMWTAGPILQDSLEVLSSWGFNYKQIAFVWDKQRVNPGYYTMTQCEYVLVGTHKKIPTPRGARNVKQLISQTRTRHSEKPEGVQDRIEEMFPTQTKLELFARRERAGWDCWGNEIEGGFRVAA